MINDKIDEVIGELFQSLLPRCQIGLETSMKDFIFHEVISYLIVLIYYIMNTIKIFKRGGSYIDSPDWIKKKNATINPINQKR